MRKTAVTFTVSSLILGIFGAFLRWLQNINAFDAATGCLEPGKPITAVVLIYGILAVAAVIALSLWLSRRFDCPKNAAALQSGTVIPTVLAWFCCGLFVIASVLLMFTAFSTPYPMFQRLLGAFGILAGLCFPFLFGKNVGGSPIGRPASAVAVLFFSFWLVYTYRMNANSPVVWSYAVEILAAAASAAAFYYVAAFHYGSGTFKRAFVAVQLGVFFSIATLFDSHSTPLTILYAVTAILLAMAGYLMISNLTEKQAS